MCLEHNCGTIETMLSRLLLTAGQLHLGYYGSGMAPDENQGSFSIWLKGKSYRKGRYKIKFTKIYLLIYLNKNLIPCISITTFCITDAIL